MLRAMLVNMERAAGRDVERWIRAVFILDGLAALGDRELVAAGQDLAGQSAVVMAFSFASWSERDVS